MKTTVLSLLLAATFSTSALASFDTSSVDAQLPVEVTMFEGHDEAPPDPARQALVAATPIADNSVQLAYFVELGKVTSALANLNPQSENPDEVQPLLDKYTYVVHCIIGTASEPLEGFEDLAKELLKISDVVTAAIKPKTADDFRQIIEEIKAAKRFEAMSNVDELLSVPCDGKPVL